MAAVPWSQCRYGRNLCHLFRGHPVRADVTLAPKKNTNWQYANCCYKLLLLPSPNHQFPGGIDSLAQRTVQRTMQRDEADVRYRFTYVTSEDPAPFYNDGSGRDSGVIDKRGYNRVSRDRTCPINVFPILNCPIVSMPGCRVQLDLSCDESLLSSKRWRASL